MNKEKMAIFTKEAHEKLLALSNKADEAPESAELTIKANRLILELCEDSQRTFSKYAYIMNQKYGYDLDNDDIEFLLKIAGLRSSRLRQEVFEWTGNLVESFRQALEKGTAEACSQFKNIRSHEIKTRRGGYRGQFRIGALAIYKGIYQLGKSKEDMGLLVRLKNTLGKSHLYSLTDLLSSYCGAGINTSRTQEIKLDLEQAKRRIRELESELQRTDILFKDMQEEMQAGLQDSKKEMLLEFFKKLNSNQFGQMLDQLYSLRGAHKKLKKRTLELPLELTAITGIITNFYKLFSEYKIQKIQELNEVFDADKEMLAGYNYDGFELKDGESIRVRVIEPGWRMLQDDEDEPDLIISKPRVMAVDDVDISEEDENHEN